MPSEMNEIAVVKRRFSKINLSRIEYYRKSELTFQSVTGNHSPLIN